VGKLSKNNVILVTLTHVASVDEDSLFFALHVQSWQFVEK